MFYEKLRDKYIAIDGVIGVGKTTLTKFLCQQYSLPMILEVVEENPFLSKFYEDMERWGFQTQLFFLVSRFDQQEILKKILSRGRGLVSDYTFEKDQLFAHLTLKGDHLKLYDRIFNILYEQVPKPDLIIYLYASVDILMSRIALRDRPFERKMSRNYISMLHDAYENHFNKYSNENRTKILRIDTTNIDFVKKEKDQNIIIEALEEKLQ
ncbi:MAG: deoxynucleoside kinase [Kosmotogaceae bacterium]|jgi:deoxyguanosine kinase